MEVATQCVKHLDMQCYALVSTIKAVAGINRKPTHTHYSTDRGKMTNVHEMQTEQEGLYKQHNHRILICYAIMTVAT